MGTRFHDTQFPADIVERLQDAGLEHNLSAAATMAARCGACILRQGTELTSFALANCLGVERTTAAHQLAKLVDKGLLHQEGTQHVSPIRARHTYVPVNAAKAAFFDMPSLSGCANQNT